MSRKMSAIFPGQMTNPAVQLSCPARLLAPVAYLSCWTQLPAPDARPRCPTENIKKILMMPVVLGYSFSLILRSKGLAHI